MGIFSKDKPKQKVVLYYMGLHYGICHGPVDFIREIIIKEKVAWRGEQAINGALEIDKEELFGGVKKEGGAVGSAYALLGAEDQTIPEFLAAKVGLTTATMPAYRGICSIWFTEGEGGSPLGFYWSANSPFIPATWIKVARASLGLTESIARIYRSAQEIITGTVRLTWWQSTFEQVTNDQGRLGVAFFDADDNMVGSIQWAPLITMPDPIPVWTERTFSANVPNDEDDEDVVKIRIYMEMHRRTGTNNDCYIDDISATINGRPITIENPGAETGSMAGWTNEVGAVAVSTTWPAHSGDWYFYGGVVADSRAYQDVYTGVDFDSNPAHIIHDCLTNTDWGMGATNAMIDMDSFESAAQVLYDEQFGLSLQWTKQSSIESFISEIIDHIEATIFINPRNGLITIKLIRGDYDIDDLDIYTPDNSEVTRFGRKLWGETINEIIVSFTNPDNEESETLVAQDLANITIQGGIVSDSRNYYGVRVRSLAARLAQRDLRTAAIPLATCDIEINREAWDLLPGDVLVLNSPEDGILSMVMRVGTVDYGKPGDPTVKASLMEDVFALAAGDYTVPPGPEDDEDEEPAPAANTYVFTLPYFFVVNLVEIVGEIDYPESFAGILASQSGEDSVEFELLESSENVGTLSVAVRATLTDAIVAEVFTDILSFSNRSNGPGPVVGGFMLIGEGDEDTIELCEITDFGVGGYTLRRGVLDTTPKDWPAGTPVWFVNENQTFTDDTVRAAAEIVDYQVLMRTSLGLLDESLAPTVSETLTERLYLPSRPADVKVNGVGFGISDAIDVNPIPVTWANRNRVTESAVVLSWDDPSVTPEVGQTTTIYVTDLDGNVLTTISGLTGTSYNLSPAAFMGEFEGYVKVFSSLGGSPALESLQGFAVRVRVDGDFFLLEDGEYFLQETGDRTLIEG